MQALLAKRQAKTPPTLTLGKKAAFVLGNGPSLAGLDLKSLSAHATFGMNAAYRHWEKIWWRPTHFACLDLELGLSHLDGIRRLIREGHEGATGGARPVGQFLLRQNLIEALGTDGADDRITNFDVLSLQAPLLAAQPITTGSHSLLWAAHLGYSPVIILGVDGYRAEMVSGAVATGETTLEIRSETGPNPNYYFDDYQRPGDRYHLPNPRPGLHSDSWEVAARKLGRHLVASGSANSAVRVFPFVEAARLIADGSAPLTKAVAVPASGAVMHIRRLAARFAGRFRR